MTSARQRASGWSLRRRVGWAFLALAALLVAALVAVAISLTDFITKGNDLVYRWQPAASISQDLLGDLVNQETGVRGYALSGETEFLTPYTDYVKQEATDLASLRKLIVGHQQLSADADGFGAAANAWRQNIADPLVKLVESHVSHDAVAIDSAAGKASFDLIRARSAALTTHLDRIRQSAVDQRRHASIVLITALVIVAGLFLVAGIALWRGLHRWVLGPVDRLAVQTREIAEGDTRQVIVPTGPPEFLDLGTDVDTMRARIADELARVEQARTELVTRGEELVRSNSDLEQFAYVASHDLSEPLRKVANFCQLLERQYGPQLDDKAKQYIAFAVDGAKRMQVLITDLLSFSRVGRTTETFDEIDTGVVLARALAVLDDRISASGAHIDVGPLPVVPGDASLLTALFQNLVGNSLKYRTEAAPQIAITAVPGEGEWVFTFTDNGIGIDAQYAERIFAIFQRLHLRDEYGGTGIGLALCRKIVEFHGGRIWLDTQRQPGATFVFTLSEGVPQVTTT